MTKINIFKCCFLFLLMGCASAYKLERKSILNFSESYYKFSPSGVKGGDSAYNIYLRVDRNKSLDKKELVIHGIYFKEKYSKLKDQGTDTYQAFINIKNNSGLLFSENNKISNTKEVKEQKLPFILEENEAVISYSINNKQKYVKIILTKKKIKMFPM